MKLYLYLMSVLWATNVFSMNVDKGSYVGIRLAAEYSVPFYKVLDLIKGRSKDEDKLIISTSSGPKEVYASLVRMPIFDMGRKPITVKGLAATKLEAQILGVYPRGKIAYKISNSDEIYEKSIFEFEKEFNISKQFFRKFFVYDFDRFPGITLSEKGEFVALEKVNADGSIQAVVVEDLDKGKILNLSPDTLNNPTVVEWAKKFKGRYADLRNPDGSRRFFGILERVKKVDDVWMMSAFDYVHTKKQDIEFGTQIGKEFGFILSNDNPYFARQSQACPKMFQMLKK